MALSAEQGTHYLTALLNRPLRIHVTDGRMFIGNMRCTDQERNVVLSATHEYRRRPGPVDNLATPAAAPLASAGMAKRFVGLVVVPGECIERIETD